LRTGGRERRAGAPEIWGSFEVRGLVFDWCIGDETTETSNTCPAPVLGWRCFEIRA